jgi:GrpB protein
MPPWVHSRLATLGPRPSGRAAGRARLGAASGCGLRGHPCHPDRPQLRSPTRNSREAHFFIRVRNSPPKRSARIGCTYTLHRHMHAQPPVIIEPYDSAWSKRFESERLLLAPVLARWLIGPIEHVGSTAVPGLPAKPVIDIMAAVEDLPSSVPAIEALKPLAYCYFEYRADAMHWFCKPSPSKRTHHLHLVPFGSLLWRLCSMKNASDLSAFPRKRALYVWSAAGGLRPRVRSP